MNSNAAFRSDGVKEIFTPSKLSSSNSHKGYENKSQMAFRSGLRSPPIHSLDSTTTTTPSTNILTKSMDHGLLIRGGSKRQAAINVANSEKPWIPSTNISNSSNSPNRGSDSLSRSWSASSASKGALASDITHSSATNYSPTHSKSSLLFNRTNYRMSPEGALPSQQDENGNEKKNNLKEDKEDDDFPVVPVGEARLSQLCREDKAKVAKLIAQVTKLRHEASNASLQVSSDSLVNTSSSSSLSAAALKVQEKLEHEVSIAQERLEVLQKDNNKLNGQTELIRTKYARSLEMLKQYQDRLVKLSEEKEDANNTSLAMKASESATSAKLLELEEELQ
jgi:hypothetical protein